MFNSLDLAIVQSQKDYNMQSTFQEGPNKPIDSNYQTKLDYKLAKVIYHYLNGTIDGLPKFEYIEKISKGIDEEHRIISSCCGLSITKDLKIDIETPIKENNEILRRDIISKDGNIAYKLITEYYINIFNKKDKKNEIVDIDTDKEPRFEKERIERLVKYLDNYNKTHNQEEKEKHI